jgi:hypothetical protein
MDNFESAQLILYSSLLQRGVTNSYGTASGNGSEMLFTNINMRVVMGNLYDSYTLYNISLSSTVIPLSGTLSGNTDSDRKLIVYMSGLGWYNNTYNFANRCNGSAAAVGLISFSGSTLGAANITASQVADTSYTTTVASCQASYPITATFGKNEDIVNIGLTYKRAIYTSGSNMPNSTNAYPAVAFIFNIVGVPAYRGDGGASITAKTPDVERRLF